MKTENQNNASKPANDENKPANEQITPAKEKISLKEHESLVSENKQLKDNLEAMKIGNDELIKEVESKEIIIKKLWEQIDFINSEKGTIATSAKAAPVTASAPGAKLEPKPGFVIAERDGEQTYFSNESWDLLGASKSGWHKATPIPKEVEDMRASNS